MNKKEKILIGYSIEFNRMNLNNGLISVKKYLNFSGIPFCHHKTYEKLIIGECLTDELYTELLVKLNINYKYNKKLLNDTNKAYTKIKRYIEFFDYDNLSNEVVKLRKFYQRYQTIYPHCIDLFFIEQIYNFYIHHKLLDEQAVQLMKQSIHIVYPDCRVILVHMLYFDCHRKNALKSNLKKVIEKLPLIDKEELLYSLIITREMIYERDFEVAYEYAKRMEKHCIDSNNVSRLCEVYQDLIAIHSFDEKKAERYTAKLKELIKNKEVHPESIKRSEYYLGMCNFSDHHFEDALIYLKNRVMERVERHLFTIALCYLSVISYLKIENDLFKIKDLDRSKMSSSEKIFFKYFLYKEKRKNYKFLVDYILDKVSPIINGDYAFEYYIFKQELFLLKAYDEMKLFCPDLNVGNYVIMHHWEEVFNKM